MNSSNYSHYIRYTLHDSGRKIYIDPELVVDFTQYVNPETDAGRKIANDIQQMLASEAGGLTSGMDTSEPNSFYMDFDGVTDQCVRVFYKVFQDDAGGLSKGPGVYIYRLRGFVHNVNNVSVGLFHMSSTAAEWRATPMSSGELNSKVLRIGSMVSSERELVELEVLARRMISASGEHGSKADFNLYHCPLAVIEYGNEYKTPEARKRIVSPQELADVFIKTSSLSEWSGKQYDQYTTYVYGDASKLLVDALRLVKVSGIQLNKFEFRLLAPYTPFSVVDQLSRACGARATLEKNCVSEFSNRYQMLDPLSLREDRFKVYSKYQGMLDSNPAITFVELWRDIKDKLLINGAV